jgi:hypothetical protein
MDFDFTNKRFTSHLIEKSNAIGERLSSSIMDSSAFLLLRSLLISSADKYGVNDYRCIVITKAEFELLPDDMDEKVTNLFQTSEFIDHYNLVINHDLIVIDCDDDNPKGKNNDVRDFYMDLSKNNNVIIFLITSSGKVNYFVDGIDGGDSIFYTKETEDSYSKKKKANEIETVLEEYRVHLTHRDTYEKFFIDHTMLNTLFENLSKKNGDEVQFKKDNICLLFNKPESRFRDDLFFYLKRNMQAIVNREDFQDDENRLDISVIDNYGTGIYLIEIKWIGKSISADGKSFGTEYKPTAAKIKSWLIQTVGYIKQMTDEHANIKKGFLAVFDARLSDSEKDSGANISQELLSEGLRSYFFRFRKVNDFRVKNTNPR